MAVKKMLNYWTGKMAKFPNQYCCTKRDGLDCFGENGA